MNRGCWLCGGQLIWMSDYSINEVYGEGEGVGTILECSDCGAEVEYVKREEE